MTVSFLSQTCSYIPFCEGVTSFISNYGKTTILAAVGLYVVAIIRSGLPQVNREPVQSGLDKSVELIQRMVSTKPYLFFSDEETEHNKFFFLSNDYQHGLFDENNKYYSTVNAFLKEKQLTCRGNNNTTEVENKIKEMEKAHRYKFIDREDMKECLLATGKTYLVYHAPKKDQDRDWSDDFDGEGANMLGIALMKIRQACGGNGVVDRPKELNEFYSTLKSGFYFN
ncbi:MAG: hypothetical protein K1000chlam3_01171 [Chlamydiae bacterium]|nr:hypothetical protein [Chlamydiota bacterium]